MQEGSANAPVVLKFKNNFSIYVNYSEQQKKENPFQKKTIMKEKKKLYLAGKLFMKWSQKTIIRNASVKNIRAEHEVISPHY